MKNLNCRLCDITNGIYNYGEIDRPFFESTSYISIASIGAMVEGWSLVLPKKHCYSMKSDYGKYEFLEAVSETANLLTALYGSLIIFEHGANSAISKTSCGTAHGHLHLVPFSESLSESIRLHSSKWIECESNQIRELVNDQEYLFYADADEFLCKRQNGLLLILDQPISQFFRNVIAKRIGLSKMANYKDYPFLNNALMTRNKLNEFQTITV